MEIHASGVPAGASPVKALSTSMLAPTDGAAPLAFWADWVCAHLVNAQCDTPVNPMAFHGRIEQRELPGMSLSQISSTAQKVTRTRMHMARGGDEQIMVNIQRAGTGRVKQGGREALLRPGDVAFYSSAEPYELSFDADFWQTVLIMPATVVREFMPEVHTLSALTLPADAMASRTLVQLADAVHGLDAHAPVAAAEAASAGLLHFLLAGAGRHLSQSPRRVRAELADARLALNALGHGVAVVDANARVSFANERAQALLASEAGLRVSHGKLEITGLGVAALCKVLHGVFTEGAPQWLPVRDSHGAMRLGLNISRSKETAMFGSSTHAVIQICSFAEPLQASSQQLMQLFGLTPAEARVAMRWVEADSIQALSHDLTVSINTLKTQIRKVYEKMGVDTKAAFVRVLMSQVPRA
jgi:DNA-binding CsgD family transcriptional regulator/PAS domain-containing protein